METHIINLIDSCLNLYLAVDIMSDRLERVNARLDNLEQNLEKIITTVTKKFDALDFFNMNILEKVNYLFSNNEDARLFDFDNNKNNKLKYLNFFKKDLNISHSPSFEQLLKQNLKNTNYETLTKDKGGESCHNNNNEDLFETVTCSYHTEQVFEKQKCFGHSSLKSYYAEPASCYTDFEIFTKAKEGLLKIVESITDDNYKLQTLEQSYKEGAMPTSGVGPAILAETFSKEKGITIYSCDWFASIETFKCSHISLWWCDINTCLSNRANKELLLEFCDRLPKSSISSIKDKQKDSENTSHTKLTNSCENGVPSGTSHSSANSNSVPCLITHLKLERCVFSDVIYVPNSYLQNAQESTGTLFSSVKEPNLFSKKKNVNEKNYSENATSPDKDEPWKIIPENKREDNSVQIKPFEISKPLPIKAPFLPSDEPTINKEVTKCIAFACGMVECASKGKISIFARVSIVNSHGYCIYDEYVKPAKEITNYCIQVSECETTYLKNGQKSFKKVRKEILKLIEKKIIVGHGLNRHFYVLTLSPPKSSVRDTSRYEPFVTMNYGVTPSLKFLASEILNIDMQDSNYSSIEEALIVMKLYQNCKEDWEKNLKTTTVPIYIPPHLRKTSEPVASTSGTNSIQIPKPVNQLLNWNVAVEKSAVSNSSNSSSVENLSLTDEQEKPVLKEKNSNKIAAVPIYIPPHLRKTSEPVASTSKTNLIQIPKPVKPLPSWNIAVEKPTISNSSNSSSVENLSVTEEHKKQVLNEKEKLLLRSHVVIELRSVMMCFPDGLPLDQLQESFMKLIGKTIPFEELDYNSLFLFLLNIPKVIRFKSVNGQIHIELVPDLASTQSSTQFAEMLQLKTNQDSPQPLPAPVSSAEYFKKNSSKGATQPTPQTKIVQPPNDKNINLKPIPSPLNVAGVQTKQALPNQLNPTKLPSNNLASKIGSHSQTVQANINTKNIPAESLKNEILKPIPPPFNMTQVQSKQPLPNQPNLAKLPPSHLARGIGSWAQKLQANINSQNVPVSSSKNEEQAKLKSNILVNLKCVIQSCKGGVPLNRLQSDYKNLIGTFIDFKQLGYSSLEAFIRDIPSAAKLKKVNNQLIVEPVADAATAHITSLISKQKSSTVKSKKRR